jgi:hypothetical protein
LSKIELLNKIEESVFWNERIISHTKIIKEVCNKFGLSRNYLNALENIFSKMNQEDVIKICRDFNEKDELLNYIYDSDYWKSKYSFYLQDENKKRFANLYENDIKQNLNLSEYELNLLKQIFISGNLSDESVLLITSNFLTTTRVTQFIERIVQSIERKFNKQAIN